MLPSVITWLRTNRIQRPSREKWGASSLRLLAGGMVSRRGCVPSGDRSQIDRFWRPNSEWVLLGPAAAASSEPDGAQAGETQLSRVPAVIVRWRHEGGPVATRALPSCVSRLGPAAAISRLPHQAR